MAPPIHRNHSFVFRRSGLLRGSAFAPVCLKADQARRIPGAKNPLNSLLFQGFERLIFQILS